MQEFLKQLSEFQKEYEEEQKQRNQFNIFTALHNEHNEKFLHSRFIAYLLSPTSKHGMGTAYLEKFLVIINKHIPKFDIENCKVRPNEQDKSEYKDIDILIQNGKQSIIIENKIFAKDSNKDKNKENDIQLVRYRNKIIEKGYQEKDIFIFYLTLDRHKPERYEEIKFPIFLIDYRIEISKWIDDCKEITTDSTLKEILQQYKIVINCLTNNVKRAKEIKALIAKQIDFDSLWHNKEKIYKIGDFDHIKWHTIDDFWNELTDELMNTFQNKIEIINKITAKEITNIAHRLDKKAYGLICKFSNGNEMYIVNDADNGLTYGYCNSEIKLRKNEHWDYIDKEIIFSKFESQKTFELINEGKRSDLIKTIIAKITNCKP